MHYSLITYMNIDKENVREGEMEMHQCLSQTLDVGKKKNIHLFTHSTTYFLTNHTDKEETTKLI